MFCEHSLSCVLNPAARPWLFLLSWDMVSYLKLLWLLLCLTKLLYSLLGVLTYCVSVQSIHDRCPGDSFKILLQRLDQWMWKAEKSVSSGGRGPAPRLMVWLWAWHLINLCLLFSCFEMDCIRGAPWWGFFLLRIIPVSAACDCWPITSLSRTQCCSLGTWTPMLHSLFCALKWGYRE